MVGLRETSGEWKGQEKGRCTKVDFKHLKRWYMEEGLDLLCVIPRNRYKVIFGGDGWEGDFCLSIRKGFLTNRVI